MHECCNFSRSREILVDIQFVFVNPLNFWGKQMQLAFVIWFKKQKRSWPDFCCFCGQSTITSFYINVLFTCLIGGGWMICHFYYLSPFCFLKIEFHRAFSMSGNIIPLSILILYCDWIVIGQRDLFLSCPLYIFPYSSLSSCLLHLSLCLISVLLYPCVSVWEKLVHEFQITYSHAQWYFIFSLFDARETKHAQRTLL